MLEAVTIFRNLQKSYLELFGDKKIKKGCKISLLDFIKMDSVYPIILENNSKISYFLRKSARRVIKNGD